jgi:flavodoxin I
MKGTIHKTKSEAGEVSDMRTSVYPRVLVAYDSAYGNTEKVAKAIATISEAQVHQVSELNPKDIHDLDVLIVGSPTQGGRPTPAMQKFLAQIPADGLKNLRAAAFDTRFAAQDHGLGLRLLMRAIGYAAGRIATSLENKGGFIAVPPEGFIVEDKEGPLKNGELERASIWAKLILQKL